MDRIPFVRRALLTERPLWQALLLTILAVAVPTAARWMIDGGHGGIQFATYFPVILLVALFLDWRFGAATALFSGVIANRLFRSEPVLFYTSLRDFLMFALFVLTCAFLIWMGATLRRLIRELDDARHNEAELNRELLHRARNMLSIVGALASMTARHSPGQDFVAAFGGRIAALRRATDMLEQDERLRDVATLVERALAAFRTDDTFRVAGPDCEIPQETCVPLVLMLHELCTNAAKHGALSVPEGTVELVWHLSGTRHAPTVAFLWRERGGPPVPAERQPGMGSRLLQPQKGIARVEQHFAPAGLECEIEVERA